ncbi:hypothetical protein V1292_001377 [Bradyrhizobium sp. AZCC 1719]|uniref:hypothetical protein n=1 Tax=Bradyrhizobium sp. AZCC 1719 TaxID=3117028 RepID=UPI002FF0A4B2
MSPLTMFGGRLSNVHGRLFDDGALRQAQGLSHERPDFIREFARIGSLLGAKLLMICCLINTLWIQ